MSLFRLFQNDSKKNTKKESSKSKRKTPELAVKNEKSKQKNKKSAHQKVKPKPQKEKTQIIAYPPIKVKCYECGGRGEVECDCTGGCGPEAANDDCYACGGSGFHTCPLCGGAGWVFEDD